MGRSFNARPRILAIFLQDGLGWLILARPDFSTHGNSSQWWAFNVMVGKTLYHFAEGDLDLMWEFVRRYVPALPVEPPDTGLHFNYCLTLKEQRYDVERWSIVNDLTILRTVKIETRGESVNVCFTSEPRTDRITILADIGFAPEAENLKLAFLKFTQECGFRLTSSGHGGVRRWVADNTHTTWLRLLRLAKLFQPNYEILYDGTGYDTRRRAEYLRNRISGVIQAKPRIVEEYNRAKAELAAHENA